jgi:hypothetical protein
MTSQDKINAVQSLKSWAIERQLYEFAVDVRRNELLVLKEITSDYIRVIKDIEYLSNEQIEFLFKVINFNILSKENLRDLKITLIQN